MIKKIIFVMTLLLTNNLVFTQTGSAIPVSSAEKFNKRGIYSNGDLSFNGKEIISDYDGNLMLQYSTPVNLSNDLGGDVTIIYNSNVEHRCYMSDVENGYTINAPEWIIGYKGIALQTLNFETNFQISSEQYLTSPQDIPLLVSGYTFSNKLHDNSNQTIDYITILRADGSKIILENVAAGTSKGLYVEKGVNSYGYANVDSTWNSQWGYWTRKIYYQSGDGLLYEFEEERTYLSGDFATFRTTYLKRISGYDRIIDVTFEYSHNDGIHFNNPYQTGRKLITCIKSNTRRRTEGKEIEFVWSIINNSNIASLIINNINSDDEIILNSYGPPANIFDYTHDNAHSRILYVNLLTDKSGRTDTLNYYNTTDSLVKRNYFIVGEKSYGFTLLKEHIAYSGKKTVYNYYNHVFDPLLIVYPNPSDLSLMFSVGEYYIWDNIFLTGRDCFSNFMLKGKCVYEKENTQYVKTLDEAYEYYKVDSLGNRTSNGTIGSSTSHGIITAVTTVDSSQISEVKRLVVKNFSRYPVEKVFSFVLDAGSAIKLVNEKTYDETIGEELALNTNYEYDTGSYMPDIENPGNSYWSGTFIDLARELTKYDAAGSSYTTSKHRSINDIQFDTLKFYKPGLSQPYSTKKIIRHEKWFDSYGLITEKWYKNYLSSETSSDITQSNGLNYFHKINLVEKNSIYSETGLTKSSIRYEYYPLENMPLRTKLRFVISGINDHIDTTSYAYYDELIHFRKYGLPKTKQSKRGIIEEYSYHEGAVESTDETFNASATGKLADYLGREKSNTYTHYGVSLTPFQTTIKFNDGRTLGSYFTASNKKEKPDFEIDLNGYYSKFQYDDAKRLTKAVLPGNYQKEIDGWEFFEYNPLIITYNDNTGDIYPIKINEKKWLAGTKFLETNLEFDSFGRLCKTSVKNDAGTFEENSLKEYDYLGRAVKETQGGSYTSYNNYNVVGDLLSVRYEDESQKSNTYRYGQDSIIGQTYYVKIIATDESGETKTSYYDLVGNLVAEQLANNNPTIFEYDRVYRLTKVTSPEGLVTTYQYDENGNLSYKNSPDYGAYKYKYDRFNRLRFQLHVKSRELTFHNYDPLDRLLYTGVINRFFESSFNNLDPNTQNSFESVEDNLVQVNKYDTFESTGVFDETNLPQDYTMENLKGRLTASAYRDKPSLNQKWNFKLNSYDYRGQIKNQYVIE